MKKSRGITLIALVITIIILLILAGITIANLTGSGVFEKAKEAKEKYKNAQELEKSLLSEYEEKLNNLGGSSTGGGTTEKPVDKLEEEKKKITNVDTTKTNPAQALPKETKKVIEGDADKGIVIQDNEDNEWTWIEVPKNIFTTATASDQYEAIKTDLESYVTTPTNYRRNGCKDEWYASDDSGYVRGDANNLTEAQKQLNNGCGLTYNEYKEKYNKMLSSVYTNGGFWISRYEIGDKTATENNTTRTSSSGTSGKAVSQINVIPYNYITCSEAQTLARDLYDGADKSSSLLFGIQWDLTCKHIDVKNGTELTLSNCSSIGNYSKSNLTLNRGMYNSNPSSSTSLWKLYTEDTEGYVDSKVTANVYYKGVLLSSGASDQTCIMNIFDFAGNCAEITAEFAASWSKCGVAMGGQYGDPNSNTKASQWKAIEENEKSMSIGFRATLY